MSLLFCVRELKCAHYGTWYRTLRSSICISGLTSKQCDVLKKEKKYELLEIQRNASLEHRDLDRDLAEYKIRGEGSPAALGAVILLTHLNQINIAQIIF